MRLEQQQWPPVSKMGWFKFYQFLNAQKGNDNNKPQQKDINNG
jgi:hypothetical protein